MVPRLGAEGTTRGRLAQHSGNKDYNTANEAHTSGDYGENHGPLGKLLRQLHVTARHGGTRLGRKDNGEDAQGDATQHGTQDGPDQHVCRLPGTDGWRHLAPAGGGLLPQSGGYFGNLRGRNPTGQALFPDQRLRRDALATKAFKS